MWIRFSDTRSSNFGLPPPLPPVGDVRHQRRLPPRHFSALIIPCRRLDVRVPRHELDGAEIRPCIKQISKYGKDSCTKSNRASTLPRLPSAPRSDLCIGALIGLLGIQQGRLNAFVAQSLADRSQTDAAVDHLGGVAVAQLVDRA